MSAKVPLLTAAGLLAIGAAGLLQLGRTNPAWVAAPLAPPPSFARAVSSAELVTLVPEPLALADPVDPTPTATAAPVRAVLVVSTQQTPASAAAAADGATRPLIPPASTAAATPSPTTTPSPTNTPSAGVQVIPAAPPPVYEAVAAAPPPATPSPTAKPPSPTAKPPSPMLRAETPVAKPAANKPANAAKNDPPGKADGRQKNAKVQGTVDKIPAGHIRKK